MCLGKSELFWGGGGAYTRSSTRVREERWAYLRGLISGEIRCRSYDFCEIPGPPDQSCGDTLYHKIVIVGKSNIKIKHICRVVLWSVA